MSSREFRNVLVKVWGQRGQYTMELQLAAGWHGGDYSIDPIHASKAQELTDNECAWAVLGIVSGYIPEGMHMLPVVDGWIYDIKGTRLRPVA